MRKLILLVFFVALGPEAAVANSITATGPSALALAAVVADHSTLVSAFHKRVIARLFAGNTNFGFTPGRKISVTADSIVCKTSNVDITSRSCDLTFSVGKRSLHGREANELSATATVESFSKLDCTIDPNEIMKKAGGGAQCTFEAGQ
jgi:hypothetical protein